MKINVIFAFKEQDNQMNFSAPLGLTMMPVEMFGFKIVSSVQQGTTVHLDLFYHCHVCLVHTPASQEQR